jgi:hypothetical protein
MFRAMFHSMTKKKLRMCALTFAMWVGASGLALAQDWRPNDYDHDDYRYDRDSDRGIIRAARDFGFNDGATVGREDRYKRKPLNPYPRGKYSHEDHGYRRDFGDKYAYEAAYARAYREGYEQAFR